MIKAGPWLKSALSHSQAGLHCGSKPHGGIAAAAPPPFRLDDPALCGSRPLVTP